MGIRITQALTVFKPAALPLSRYPNQRQELTRSRLLISSTQTNIKWMDLDFFAVKQILQILGEWGWHSLNVEVTFSLKTIFKI